jgi:hypothetical protein
VAWEREIRGLLAQQEREGMLSEAAVVGAAECLGVGVTAVRGRFREAVGQLVRISPFRLTRPEIERIRPARSFPAAYALLVAAGATAPYAIVERRLWHVPGRELAALQARERRRRAASEADTRAASAAELAA